MNWHPSVVTVWTVLYFDPGLYFVEACYINVLIYLGLFTCLSFILAGVSLPAPVNVSIDSLNMEHTLNFLPGLGTSADAHFRVQILRFRNSWKPVAGCLELAATQTCNLTGEFTETLQQYQARVQAFTPTQESNWTLTGHFTPYTDTVLGPPKVSVSGCGNCLLLQVSPPTSGSIQQNKQLQNLYSGLLCVVRRTRDGAQFSLNLAYEEEILIRYLQPGVEYCVTVTVTATINSNSMPTEPHCAFTGPPASSSGTQLFMHTNIHLYPITYMNTALCEGGS
uniref:Interferon/interleukin receptor domain-containing protein n=1 Tax=Myripristis murdjan TaxID=586833 RepID=A0A667Z193_9TELE